MERVACNPTPECKYFGSGCYEDTDHFYWPANLYNNPVERHFRALDNNKREVCRALHEERHAIETPPNKPPLEDMISAVVLSGIYISRRLRKQLHHG